MTNLYKSDKEHKPLCHHKDDAHSKSGMKCRCICTCFIPQGVENKWFLAEFMHDEYEKYAFIFGWNTQEKTKVPFGNLPEENRKTMLAVASEIITKYEILRHSDRESYRQEIVEMVKGLVVNSLEEVKEMNKNLPSPLNEYAYNESKGYIEAIDKVLSLLNQSLLEDKGF